MGDDEGMIERYPLFVDDLWMLAGDGFMIEIFIVGGCVALATLVRGGLRSPIVIVLAVVFAIAGVAVLVSWLGRIGGAIERLAG